MLFDNILSIELTSKLESTFSNPVAAPALVTKFM